jgi:predicted RNA-binding protein YlxR (DUF448 family)
MPDGHVTLDLTGRLAGRGAYLCADGRCWQTAGARGTIARALDVPNTAELAAIIASGPPQPTDQPLPEGGARGQE